jgi:anti-sigma factor RsiW
MDTFGDGQFKITAQQYLLGTLPEYATIQVTERLENDPELAAKVQEVRKLLEAEGKLAPESELEDVTDNDFQAILSDSSRGEGLNTLKLCAGIVVAVGIGVAVLQLL